MTGSLSVASSITGSSIESDGTLSVAGDSTLIGSVTAGGSVTGNISSWMELFHSVLKIYLQQEY